MENTRLFSNSNGFKMSKIEKFIDNTSKDVVKLPYRTSNYILIYITKGKGIHEVDYVSYPLKANEVMLITRNRMHAFKEYESLEGYMISFTEGFLCEMFSEPKSSVKKLYEQSLLTPHIKSLDVHENMLNNMLLVLMDGCRDDYHVMDQMVVASVFNAFVQFLMNIKMQNGTRDNGQNEKLLEFTKLINEHLVEEKTVEGFARMMHTTKKTLNLLTRRTLDMSAKQYIDQQLLTIIKRKLSFEEISINEIAYALGFSEPSNLTRFFKQHVGVSPKVFRQEVRRNSTGWAEAESIEVEAVKGAIESNVYYIAPNALVPLHKHEDLDEVFYCIKGNGYAVLENEERLLNEGTTFVAHSDEHHSLRSEEGMYVVSSLIPIIRD